MRSILEFIEQHPATATVASAVARGGPVSVRGVAGSSASMVAGALAARANSPVVLVVAHLDDADEAVDELRSGGREAERFPALELLPGESSVSLELFAERLGVVRSLLAGFDGPRVLVCPVQALMQGVPAPGRLDALALTLRPGDARGLSAIVRWLDGAGYRRADAIEEPGDFAVRGGILDVFPPGAAPVRIDFFGDEIESMFEVDLDTMGSDRRLTETEIVGVTAASVASDDNTVSVIELFPPEACAVIVEPLEVTEQARGYYERVVDARGVYGPPAVFKGLRERLKSVVELSQFSHASKDAGAPIALPVSPLPDFSRDAAEAVRELGAMSGPSAVLVTCQNDGEQQRLHELLAEFAPDTKVESVVAYLHRGFLWGEEASGTRHQASAPESPAARCLMPFAFVPFHELLHRHQTRRRIRRIKAGRSTDAFLEVAPGDYVVHSDHGIAKFLGLKTMKPRGPRLTPDERADETFRKARGGDGAALKAVPEEYLSLEFSGGGKLHVPVTQIDKVQKYIGGNRGKPVLSSLGGKRWQNQKDSVKDSVRDLAAELLRVQAAREHLPGTRFPDDTAWQKEFEAEFPYEETEDQVAALIEIKKDMVTPRPMDRLLCGDVGYGKTELAIRAAFKAVEFGRQVAVLVPTTLLAEQHEKTFRERFAAYPFKVESLSRFKSRSEQNAVLAAARKGQVDILIGTHRLLSKDVRFADLGLVIVDEEQRFGVEHKNALLALRMTADVLTLSATPIPRTLHMAMLGLRDISSLSTPPLDRRAVVTEVIPYNEKRIQQAIARELAREGQVFFVHNRVHNIKSVADDVQRLAPDARIVVGHGQMPDDELEEVMRKFVSREADILVATTIIESGIDIPTANTMFVNSADRFGLAELHQLRGRVGRYKHRAYCYLLLPPDRPVTDIAARRLRAIEEFSMLGAGFKIAMRDLEIRGAGNLLGPEQSGHIAAVGYDMYCRLLEEAARELKNEPRTEPAETVIEIGISGSLPKAYIPSDNRRLEAYRRLASARSFEQLEAFSTDLAQAYGEAPPQAALAIELAELRIGAMLLGVRSVMRFEQDVVFRCEDPGPVVALLSEAKGTVRALSARDEAGLAEVYYRPPANYLEPGTLLNVLRTRLGRTAQRTIAQASR